MLSDVLCETTNGVETQITTKIDELKELLKQLVGDCATKQCINDKFQAMDEVLSGVERRLKDGFTEVLSVVKTNTARGESLERMFKDIADDVTNVQKSVDRTRSDVEGVMGSIGALSKTVIAVDSMVDTIASKQNENDTKVDKLTSVNETRFEALEKKVDMISTVIMETKTRIDEIGLTHSTDNHGTSTVASSFSGKDVTPLEKGISALKNWTGKAVASIIYDSQKDPFTDQCLFDKVKGKANIALVAFTSEGDLFGGFYDVTVTEQDKAFYDPNMFVFSFESHGRCETPKKFAAKPEKRDKKYVGFLNDDSDGWFVQIGGYPGYFYLGDEKSNTFCVNLSEGFECIEDDTLTGKPNREKFTCTRIVAILLE